SGLTGSGVFGFSALVIFDDLHRRTAKPGRRILPKAFQQLPDLFRSFAAPLIQGNQALAVVAVLLIKVQQAFKKTAALVFVIGGHFGNDNGRDDSILVAYVIADQVAVTFFASYYKLFFIFKLGRQLPDILKAGERIIAV